MPKVYNTTRGPITFVTASGKVASVAPKAWCEMDADEVASPSLLQHASRGSLVIKEDEAPAAEVAPVVAPAPVEISVAPAPAVEEKAEKKAEEKPVEAAPVEEAPVEEKPVEAKVEEPAKPAEKPSGKQFWKKGGGSSAQSSDKKA